MTNEQKPWRLVQTHPRAIELRMDCRGPEWEQWVFVRSDAHHDNAESDQELERRHLDECRRRNAPVLDLGDLFCAMQGKWDKRADQNALREEHRGNDYLDRLVATACDFYEPYADLIAMLAPGNHETSVTLRHGTDLTANLAESLRVRLRDRGVDHRPAVMPYNGWVRFKFCPTGGRTDSRDMWYTHGYGGGGQVTKDVIQLHRQLSYLGDVSIIASGHTHDRWEIDEVAERLNKAGSPELMPIIALKCGTYKDEYSSGRGWSAGKGHRPKPSLGGKFLRFSRYFRTKPGSKSGRAHYHIEVREPEP